MIQYTFFYLLKFIIFIITTVIYKFETWENVYEESTDKAEQVHQRKMIKTLSLFHVQAQALEPGSTP